MDIPQEKAELRWAESKGRFRWRLWRGYRTLAVKMWVQTLLHAQPQAGIRTREVQSPVLLRGAPRQGRLSVEGDVWVKRCTGRKGHPTYF